MKKLILLISIFVVTVFKLTAQSQGISYQAILIDKNDKEIPGIDVQGNYLPNQAITLRFSISDENGTINYQEEHETSTDKYGMINVTIGWGAPTISSPGTFMDIDWDGAPKDLLVEISLGEISVEFEEFSEEMLTFVPYAYHRNITATGTMIIEDVTDLNSDLNVNNGSPTNLSGTLNVDLMTDLNGDVNVNNASATNLSGTLTVDEETNLNNDLNVNNTSATNLSGTLTVDEETSLNNDLNVNNGSATNLSGTLSVDDETNLNSDLNVVNGSTTDLSGNLTVNAESFLNGQLTIDADVNGTQSNYNSYPLLVRGSTQGIAITVDAGTPNNDNNFISFFNSSHSTVGCIEGENTSELHNSFDFVWNTGMFAAEEALILAEGIACGFQLDFGEAAVMAAEGAVAIASYAEWEVNRNLNVGITFSSGSGDYAEWLEKKNPSEKFTYGDIVGVIGGKITKHTNNADHFMVVSHSPIVLGNMPQKQDEKLYEKVAFIGQVLVKVKGVVNIGDYIIPSGQNNGFGIAISPDHMLISDYNKIIGVAWSNSKSGLAFNFINVAVGINTNDLVFKLQEQQKELNQLKTSINTITDYLKSKDPEFNPSLLITDDKIETKTNNKTQSNIYLNKFHNTKKIIDYTAIEKIVKEDTELYKLALDKIRVIYENNGIKVDEIPELKKLFEDPYYTLVFLKKYSTD